MFMHGKFKVASNMRLSMQLGSMFHDPPKASTRTE